MNHNNPLTRGFWQNLVDNKIGTTISLIAYFKQSIMATLFLLIYFLIWNHFIPIQNQIIFSAIASSAFLTFISTSIYDSLSKKIIGGQLVGIIIGVSLWYLLQYTQNNLPKLSNEIFIVFLSLSAGLALFFMAVLNLEHPPGAGTAMAFVFNKNSPAVNDFFFIIICASLLALTHMLLKKHHLIKNLEGRDVTNKKASKLSRISQYFKKK
ncbi:MAG: HPP family protein [Alcanivoracaceae bacterium]|nr:HPP family protein [Alcanivoracaceae bacterium]